MAKPRVTATDRLSNVIEVVELGRRTGLLAVERGAGTNAEDGFIYFISGRAVYAALGSLRGREALAVLAHWADCRFSFDPSAPPPPNPNVPGSVSALDALDGTTRSPRSPATSTPGDGSGSWRLSNVPNMPQSSPSSGMLGQPSAPALPATSSGSYGGAGGYGSFGTGAAGGNPERAFPATPYSASFGGYPSEPTMSPGMGSRGGGTAPSGARFSDAELLRRPRRAPDVRDLMAVVTSHNLSRSHRTVLLLADGEHSVIDLARLSSRSLDETVQLLGELETRGLIYYYS